MRVSTTVSALALTTIWGLFMSCLAQGALPGEVTNGTISATGAASIKRSPETLRLQIEVSAKAKNLKDALAALKTLREGAVEKLTKMDAVQDSIKIADPHINTAISNRQRQMEMMVRQRMRQGGKKAKKATEKPITVSATLTAEWKLKATEPEALLLEAQTIEDKVRAAELSGGKGTQGGEYEELAEEMADVEMYDDGQLQPGEPIFIYVTRISDEDRSKALAEAFAKAQKRAGELSRAAGVGLGPLSGLTSQSGRDPMSGQFGMYGMGNYDNRRAMIMQMMAQSTEAMTEEPSEAIGVHPNDVTLMLHVNATFRLDK